MSLALNARNAPPRFDGDRTDYLSLAKKQWAPGCTQRSVVYVNGMATSAEAHRWTALALSEVSDSQVLGIYNLQGKREHYAFETVMRDILQDPNVPDFFKSALRGLNTASMYVHDAGQCIRDYLGPLEQRIRMQWHNGWGERARYHVIRHVLRYNPAIQSLVDVLNAKGAGRAVQVVCHSQGNLVSTCAIEAMKWVRGGYPGRIHVYALASPALYWDNAVAVHTYTNVQDPITWLSLGRSQDGAHIEVADTALSPLTWLRAHNVDLYVYQQQFVRDLRRELGV